MIFNNLAISRELFCLFCLLLLAIVNNTRIFVLVNHLKKLIMTTTTTPKAHLQIGTELFIIDQIEICNFVKSLSIKGYDINKLQLICIK